LASGVETLLICLKPTEAKLMEDAEGDPDREISR
jgi:hypothetical protein